MANHQASSAACTCDPALWPNVTDARCPRHGVAAFIRSLPERSGVRGPVGEPPRPSSNRAPDTSAARRFGVSYIPDSRFVGGRWYRYLRPRRLTLASNPPIYRWLVWNFGWTP
jgi:hypothetical protein